MTIRPDLGLTGTSTERPHRAARGGCGCGGDGPHGVPVLDARTIPHLVRHGAVIGALDQLPAGQPLVLVAPHDPRRLLQQVEERSPGGFDVEYLGRGPEAWQRAFTRRS